MNQVYKNNFVEMSRVNSWVKAANFLSYTKHKKVFPLELIMGRGREPIIEIRDYE